MDTDRCENSEHQRVYIAYNSVNKESEMHLAKIYYLIIYSIFLYRFILVHVDIYTCVDDKKTQHLHFLFAYYEIYKN